MLLTTSQSNDCPQRRWRHLLLLQQRPRRQSQKLQQQPNNCDLDKKRSQIRRRIHNRCCHLVSIQTTTKFSRVVMTAGAVLFLLLSLFSNSNLVVVMGQNFGTGSEGVAVQLPSVDDSPVSVEALNKARIQAELDHEEQSRKHTQNVVRLAATDQLHSDIVTNRTRAYLSCESGEMIVKINFTEPFRGVGYSDYDRSSPCKFYGDGGRYYELRLPLKGCGTKQEAPRIFLNNIIVRFHRSLELEEDEIKTIICRYPPPLAPPPPLIAAPM